MNENVYQTEPEEVTETETLSNEKEVTDIADDVIDDYSKSITEGDKEKRETIVKKINENPELADALVKQVETRRVEALKEELKFAVSRGARLLRDIANTRNQWHAVNDRAAGRLSSELNSLYKKAQAAENANTLTTSLIQLDDWLTTNLAPAVNNSMNQADAYFNRRVPQELIVEAQVLKSMKNLVSTTKESSIVLRDRSSK